MRLLLFDVDGTLLRVNAGGQLAIRRAVSSVTGRSVTTADVSFSGRTDPAIFREVLQTNDLPNTEDLLAKVLRAYVDEARETIHYANVEPLPGVAALLARLAAQDDVYLGLVTGNVEPVAFHKLRGAGLADHFSTGAFGSDHAVRSKLPALAARRAANTAGHAFPLENTVVVGDTVHDVDCARKVGARSVAVSSGRPSHEELAAHTPDLLLESLEDTAGIVDKLLAL